MTSPSPPTTDAAAPGFPRAFGKYLLAHPLAEGGMGAVFLAKSGSVTGIEKVCVVKTLRPALLADDDYAARFLDEARLVVQLAHRNICGVFDVGQIEGRYYLAMEHISGRDVRTLLAGLQTRAERLEEGAALHLMAEVLDALDYAHRLQDPRSDEPLHLVHRDVSPQNIMVNFEGEVKLIDFGLAASTIKGQKTEPHQVMGKIAYMSPEQARGEAVDARADQFAAAIVLYEVLTSARYYGDRTPHEIWGLSGSGEYRPERLDILEPDLRSLLRRALATKPEERFPSCAEFREALETAELARGVRSGDGRRELRDRMQKLFEQERQSERQVLAKVAALETQGLLDLSSFSLAAVPSKAPAPSPASDLTIVTTKHTSDESTTLHVRAAGLASNRSRYAVLGAVVLAVLLVIFLIVRRDADEVTVAIASVPPISSTSLQIVNDSDGQVLPIASTTGDPVSSSSAARQAGNADGANAAAKDGSEGDLANPNAASNASERPRRPRSSKAVKPAEPPTGYAAMLSYAKRWCAAEPCSREVLGHDAAMRAKGEPSTDDLLKAVQALRECVARCSR